MFKQHNSSLGVRLAAAQTLRVLGLRDSQEGRRLGRHRDAAAVHNGLQQETEERRGHSKREPQSD